MMSIFSAILGVSRRCASPTQSSPLARVMPEQVLELSNEQFRISSSTRAGALRSITVAGDLITRHVEGELHPGSHGAFLPCCSLYGEFPNRTVQFPREDCALHLPLPEGLEKDSLVAKARDRYHHGLSQFFTWERVQSEPRFTRLELSASRLPANYPFPCTQIVEYDLREGSDFIIRVGIRADPRVQTKVPAALAMHPYFQYNLTGQEDQQARLQGKVTHRFDTGIPREDPVGYGDEGPFKATDKPGPLSTKWNNTFISGGDLQLSWPGGPKILMKDETPSSVCEKKFFRLWTHVAQEQGLFGISHGGLENLFGLMVTHRIDRKFLPLCDPGQEIFRVLRMSVL